MPVYCTQEQPIPSYFVVMIDYGRKGCEAIVDPEITYRGIVERVASREYKNIRFIQHVANGLAFTITDEVLRAAGVDSEMELA